MPAQSGPQYRWLQAVAHGAASGKGSMTAEKAHEWIHATPPDKRKMFAKSKKHKGKRR